MTTELEKTVNDVLIGAIQKAKEGTDFLAGQVPDVIDQLLRWSFWSSVVWMTMWGVVFIIFVWCGKTLGKNLKAQGDDEEWKFLPYVLSIFPFGASFNYLLDCLKIAIAPKVWLLEYAAHLIHPGGGN